MDLMMQNKLSKFDINQLPKDLAEYRFPTLLNEKTLSEKYLATESKMDFYANFFQLPASETERIFTNVSFYKTYPSYRALKLFIGMDIATGKTNGDFTAIVVVGLNSKEKKLYLMDIVCRRISLSSAYDWLASLFSKYNILKASIEDNIEKYWQNQLFTEVGRASGGKLSENFLKSRIKFKRSRTNKVQRIESIEPLMTMEKLVLPHPNLVRNKSDFAELYKQFRLFSRHSSYHDDGLDALEMAVRVAIGRKRDGLELLSIG